MSIPETMRQFTLAEHPTGELNEKTFNLETKPAPKEADLKDNQVIIKVIAFSNDPAQRMWLAPNQNPKRSYAPPIQIGDPIRSSVLGEVVATKSDKFAVGDRLVTIGSWSEYLVVDVTPYINKAASIPGQSEYISMALLGMTGMTAWSGVFKEMKLKPEQTVVVSGAAGAVGSVIIQLAKKVVGCAKVVGIAGGKEKCDWVKSLGADECIDYKDPDYVTKLAEALPDYADAYFDNVGGEILDNMLPLIKRLGYVSVCGAISGYNKGMGIQLKNWGEVISNRITLKGYIVIDHLQDFPVGGKELAGWLIEGKISNTQGETVVDTKFEDVPETYKLLFKGANQGKLITRLV